MKHIYTAADMAHPDMLDTYRELHKEIHGFKDRSEHVDLDRAADFMNNYDKYFQEAMEQERRELSSLSEVHGIDFPSMTAYYDHIEKVAFVEHVEAIAEEALQDRNNAAYNRRWSTEAAAEDFLDCLERDH